MTIPEGPVVVAEVQAQQPFRNLDAKGRPALVSEIKVPAVAEPSSLDRYLVVSPYHEQEHLLDLESLDVENQLLALSLTKLKCLRQDYATAPYTETFNWEEIIETLQTLAGGINHTWKKTSFFVVAFRSRIPPTTVYAELGTLDKAAHAEATASGGFLKYVGSDAALASENPLTLVAGIGLGLPTPRAATWRRASGDHRRTQGKEAQGRLTARRLVQRGRCIPSGRSTATS
jgi:hypothetical protein